MPLNIEIEVQGCETLTLEIIDATVFDKEDVGLGAVDNTSDADKPVSTAVADALDDKLNKPPLDGVLYGVRNGVFVPIMAGSTAQA